MAIKILIVDDHEPMRECISSILAKEDDMEIVGQSGDGMEAILMAHERTPHVVIMDIVMPNMNGIEAARRIVNEVAGTRVVAISIYSDKRFVTGMLNAGASGYLLKDTVFKEMTTAIRKVANGGTYLSKDISMGK